MQNLAFYLFAIVAVSCYGALTVIAKKLQVSIPPLAFIALAMTILAALSLGSYLLFERSFSIRSVDASQWTLLLVFGAINLIGFAFLLKAISGMSVGHYQIIAVLTPIVGACLAYFWLGEQVGARFFLAIPVLLTGLLIAFL